MVSAVGQGIIGSDREFAGNSTDFSVGGCPTDRGTDDVAVADAAIKLMANDAADIVFSGNIGPVEGKVAHNRVWIISIQIAKEPY